MARLIQFKDNRVGEKEFEGEIMVNGISQPSPDGAKKEIAFVCRDISITIRLMDNEVKMLFGSLMLP